MKEVFLMEAYVTPGQAPMWYALQITGVGNIVDLPHRLPCLMWENREWFWMPYKILCGGRVIERGHVNTQREYEAVTAKAQQREEDTLVSILKRLMKRKYKIIVNEPEEVESADDPMLDDVPAYRRITNQSLLRRLRDESII